ncbi:MAG: monophosphatase [Actinomycetota bacterium]|nr:monophosphatase [Actinomycetota bacterium]
MAPAPGGSFGAVTDDRVLAVLNEAATAVGTALEALQDWGLAGTRAGQYRSDLLADEVALEVLLGAGLGVLSEETGLHHPERAVTVALDPVDGSTNASRKLPWYATSLCAVDAGGPLAAVVVNLATGDRFEAVRGAGATLNGRVLEVSDCTAMADAVVCLNGWPVAHLGWRQMRAMGATALDICAVGAGQLDAYIDCSDHANAPWDYLGGVLVCREAGGLVADAEGRELVTLGLTERRTPVAAATEKLLAEALAARTGLG